MLRRMSWFGVLVLLLVAGASEAQVVRGTVHDRASVAPLSGVIVLLVDSAGQTVARALTGERGEYRLSADRPGTFRVRSLRIGFRPAASDPIVLAAGQEFELPPLLAGVPVVLDTLRVAARSACEVRPDSGTAAFAAWEQVAAALAAAQLSSTLRNVSATVLSYQRSVDPAGERVLEQHMAIRSGVTARPWRSVPPDSLRRAGYVVTQGESTVYLAPDLDVLLSDEFAEDHCFRLVSAGDRFGLAFEPTPARRRFGEIRGTLWLDRATAELRSLEFRYANRTRQEEAVAGGEIEFLRLGRATGEGMWLIARWNIRAPVIGIRYVGPARAPTPERVVREIRVEGGELVLVTRNRDTLWARPPLTLAGAVRDSASGAGIAGAVVALRGTGLEARTDERGRFRLPGLLPGRYTVDIQPPSLAAIGSMHSVPLTFTDSAAEFTAHVPSSAVLAGAVLSDSDGGPIPEAEVALPRLGMRAYTNAQGEFRLGDIPAGTHEVLVRRVGFRAVSEEIAFAAHQVVERRFTLSRVVVLDTVPVIAMRLAEFERNRAMGLGHFLTRADLEKQKERKLGDILAQLSGVEMKRAGTAAYVASRRGMRMSLQTEVKYCEVLRFEVRSPVPPCACYTQVYLDNILIYQGLEQETVPDINQIPPSWIEAIEYYAGPAQAPARYNRLNAHCGVLVIHTKRSP